MHQGLLGRGSASPTNLWQYSVGDSSSAGRTYRHDLQDYMINLYFAVGTRCQGLLISASCLMMYGFLMLANELVSPELDAESVSQLTLPATPVTV